MQIFLSDKQIMEHLEMIDSHLHMPYKEFHIPHSQDGIMRLEQIAQAMMMHVGLYGYEPVIKYDHLDTNTGGFIKLNNNSDNKVYITISDDLPTHFEIKYAILAHEICHKLLYTHNCYFPDMGDYNESLTDISTIYVGFGKLTLNGCIVISHQWNRVFDLTTSNPSLQQSRITYNTGYLSLEQYAMAYRLVCHVNHIPKEDYEAGLDQEALPMLRSNKRIKSLEKQLLDLPELLRKFRIKSYKKDAALLRDVVMMEAYLQRIKDEIILRQKSEIESLGIADGKTGEITNPYRVMQKAIASLGNTKMPLNGNRFCLSDGVDGLATTIVKM